MAGWVTPSSSAIACSRIEGGPGPRGELALRDGEDRAPRLVGIAAAAASPSAASASCHWPTSLRRSRVTSSRRRVQRRRAWKHWSTWSRPASWRGCPPAEIVLLRRLRQCRRPDAAPHYLDWGVAGRPPPLLFLHGGCLTRTPGDLVCLDLRGGRRLSRARPSAVTATASGRRVDYRPAAHLGGIDSSWDRASGAAASRPGDCGRPSVDGRAEQRAFTLCAQDAADASRGSSGRRSSPAVSVRRTPALARIRDFTRGAATGLRLRSTPRSRARAGVRCRAATRPSCGAAWCTTCGRGRTARLTSGSTIAASCQGDGRPLPASARDETRPRGGTAPLSARWWWRGALRERRQWSARPRARARGADPGRALRPDRERRSCTRVRGEQPARAGGRAQASSRRASLTGAREHTAVSTCGVYQGRARSRSRATRSAKRARVEQRRRHRPKRVRPAADVDGRRAARRPVPRAQRGRDRGAADRRSRRRRRRDPTPRTPCGVARSAIDARALRSALRPRRDASSSRAATAHAGRARSARPRRRARGRPRPIAPAPRGKARATVRRRTRRAGVPRG
mgnify:CR=1 FL=1